MKIRKEKEEENEKQKWRRKNVEMKITENQWWSAQAALRLSHVQFCQYSSFHAVQEEMVVVVLLNLLAVSHACKYALA